MELGMIGLGRMGNNMVHRLMKAGQRLLHWQRRHQENASVGCTCLGCVPGRQAALAETELAEAQVRTIRLKLLKIGGLVKRSARLIVLHLASACPQQQLFRLIVDKLTRLPNTTGAQPI